MAQGIGNILAPWRFLLFIGLLPVATLIASPSLGLRHGVLAGFDVASFAFLATLPPLFREAGAAAMRRRSAANDANRALMLAITGATMLVVLAAVALELAEKDSPEPAVIALVIGTLALSWIFSNTIYALHYAHIFYRRDRDGAGDAGGLDFPQEATPDYWDFAYFAFTLGMTFQTSDVSITTRGVRIVALFHCLAAFVFNLGVVAFTVNILGG